MIPVDASYHQLQSLFQETMYSRIPVYEEDTENIIGIVMLKDFFLVKKQADFSIRSILREPFYTYETKKTDELLKEMQENSNSLAIVLDEYGAAIGLITLEDLLEEIVGEIHDEYDESEKELIQTLDQDLYRIAGAMKVDDINDALHTSLSSEHYDSIGGLIIEQLDRLPHAGESVTLSGGYQLTAGEIVKNRIRFVDLQLPASSEPETETQPDQESEEAKEEHQEA